MRRGTRWMVASLVALGLSVYGLAPVGAAEEEKQARDSIFIRSDEHFNPANGVRSGSGMPADPYVISGWRVDRIEIKDTSAAVVIRDNDVTRQLTLNWNGGNVKVVDNRIGDLRVNQNVKRTGEPTSGLIARNTFGVVGQLRHFDGIFEENVVTGRRSMWDDVPFFENGQSVNFDGFNGSRFRNNTINGFVTVRLHGHHHSSGYGDDSHYHGAGEMHGAEAPDHTNRYHQVFITNNVITSPGPYALNYVDTAHSANDRTAASETNPELNKPHVHYTKVHMNNNRLIGSGLYVDIFNAKDERHLGTRTGMIEIANNTIQLVQESDREPFFAWEEPAGISIYRARDVHMMIMGNKVTNKDERSDAVSEEDIPFFRPEAISGVRLFYIDEAQIHIGNNLVASTDYGVSAAEMPKTVEWWIHDLTTKGVGQAVYWDNSVANQPHQD